jgi:hypothetical protein
MSKSNIEILNTFLSLNSAEFEDYSSNSAKEILSLVTSFLEGKTEADFNTQFEQVLKEDNAHAEYLRDLIADIYFQEDTTDDIKSKITVLSASNSMLSDELEFRTNLKKLYLIEQRPVLKKKLQELTELEVAAATASAAPAASVSPAVSYFKPLAIAASVLLVVIVGYFIFRNTQQTQIAKVEYKIIPIAVINTTDHQGFAGNGPQDSSITVDSCIVGIIKDSITAYKYFNDTFTLKTNIKVDSIKIVREVSNDSDKIHLYLNTNKYQIMETEKFLYLVK